MLVGDSSQLPSAANPLSAALEPQLQSPLRAHTPPDLQPSQLFQTPQKQVHALDPRSHSLDFVLKSPNVERRASPGSTPGSQKPSRHRRSPATSDSGSARQGLLQGVFHGSWRARLPPLLCYPPRHSAGVLCAPPHALPLDLIRLHPSTFPCSDSEFFALHISTPISFTLLFEAMCLPLSSYNAVALGLCSTSLVNKRIHLHLCTARLH